MQELEQNVDDKINFAKEQSNFLKNNGIQDPTRLSQIFEAAGPGQVKEAWKLAHSNDWDTEKGKTMKDILCYILHGALRMRYFGKARVKESLKNLGFYVPEAYNSACFFKVLSGALEILIPNSHKKV